MRYSKPPLTESVVEFRTEQVRPEAEIRKLAARYRRSFPHSEDIQNFTFEIGPAAKVVAGELDSVKLFSKDAADLVVVRKFAVSYIRHPPYAGWDDFIVKAGAVFSAWRRAEPRRRLTRIGLRALNRIDVPKAEFEKNGFLHYISASIQVPGWDSVSLNFSFQLLGENSGFRTLIGTSLMESPLIDHQGVFVDIDVGREVDVPQGWNDIADVLEAMHSIRDRGFESMLSDASRGLIR